MDFLTRDFTFTVNGLALTGVLVFGMLSFVAIIYYISHLWQRIRKFEKPTYGFLGKSLYSLIAIGVMLAGLGFFSYSFSVQEDFTIQAERTLTADIRATVAQKGDQTSVVDFKAVPIVDDSRWAGGEAKFDLLWNIKGPEIIDNFEFERSLDSPSGFSKELKNGAYEVKLVIVFEGKSYEFTEQFTV